METASKSEQEQLLKAADLLFLHYMGIMNEATRHAAKLWLDVYYNAKQRKQDGDNKSSDEAQ